MKRIYAKPEIAVTSFEAGTRVMIASGVTQDVTADSTAKVAYSTLK